MNEELSVLFENLYEKLSTMMDFFFARDFFKQKQEGSPPYVFYPERCVLKKKYAARAAQTKGRDDVIVTGTRELLFRGREFVH